MQQAPPSLLDSLAQQQTQIADALGDLEKRGSSQASALGLARHAATQAAQQLGRADLPQAVESLRAAQGALAQALSAQPAAPQTPGEPPRTLPQLAQQQQQAYQIAKSTLDKLQSASDAALRQAEDSLESAGTALGPVTAGELGPLPPAVDSALQSAQGSITESAAQAAAGQGVPANAQASAAAQALARAQAALALAQNGLGSQNLAEGSQGQGQGQGEGQKGQGQAQGQGQGVPSRSQGPGQGAPSPQGNGRQGNWAGPGGADGPRRATAGPGRFTGLPARDRAAILQSQSEKYPQEYGPLVEQYLKNLSDQAGSKEAPTVKDNP
jgi:hypothetical protein